jgi:monovalent cation:H+ antiporter, CPA1 family
MPIPSLTGSTAGIEEAVVLLLIIAAAVAVGARRVGVPYTIGLVLVGLAVGVGAHVEALRLSSDLVFYVFLPILLFEAAFNLEARQLREQWRRIAALAVPGVLVAFVLTALGVHLLGGMAWSLALLFGALITATDPVSVVSLFHRLGVSERLTTLVDAESLYNDGAAAVLFAVVLSVVVDGHTFTVGWAAGTFVWMAAGGLAVGLLVGYGASFVHRHLDDHLIEITLSTIVAYGSFLLAQWLGMSGVVACVTAAIVLGNLGRRRTMSPVTRVTMSTVWEYAAFVANSLIFLLIGLSMHLSLIAAHVGLVLIAFVVVVAARAVTIYGYGLIARLFGAGLPFRWQHVLVWGGLRGTIALALVLSVPAAVTGRATLEVVTFGVVLLSLVGQGLTVPWLTRRLGLEGQEASVGRRRREVLLEGFVGAHEELDRLQEAGIVPGPERRHLQQTIEEQEDALLDGMAPLADEPTAGDDERLAARLGALLAQRRRIVALRGAGAVDEALKAALLAELDDRVALLAERLAGGSTHGERRG